MKLKEIIKDIKIKNLDELDINIDIKHLNNKAQKVLDNSLFFCYDGENYRGEDVVATAIKNGATFVVVEKMIENINCQQIVVDNVRSAMSKMAKNFYQISDELKFVGVTGTNGKTTTTNIIRQILCQSGIPAGVIGTEGCFYNDKKIDRGLTTPDPIELFSIIKQMQNDNIKYIVMEVSAHAIALCKVDAIKFCAKILTNITQDHLDYFKTMENYAKTKLSFLTDDAICIANADDSFVSQLCKNSSVKKFSIKKPADIYVTNTYIDGSFDFCIDNKIYSCKSNFKGDFNISNLISAILCTKMLGIDVESALKAIKNIMPVVGRMNIFTTADDINLIVDFAHTPDGLEKILKTVRKFTKNNLICVFGCGGNRDAKKRPKMGKLAEDLSDFVIVTNDNPRYEREEDIANEIESGMTKTNHKIICDRKKAIMYSKYISSAGDSIVFCGKGAENYQEINGIKYPYSEFDEINKNFALKDDKKL